MDREYLQTPEQWTRFLSSFVHEVRTPLASLRMLTDLLAQGSLKDPAKRYADNIQDVVLDLQSLLGDIAELGQLLAGRAVVRPVEVVLELLVDQVQEAVRPQAWERGIAITDSLDPALPRSLHADPDRVRRAFTLILGSAVSHAESEVFFRLDLDNGNLCAIVSSDGAPFPEEELLALPLANELARVLGGTLCAGNRGGRPTFDLSLPIGG